jgi:hypothetical protein
MILRNVKELRINNKILVYIQFFGAFTSFMIVIATVLLMGKSMLISGYYLINQGNIPKMCGDISKVVFENEKNVGIINNTSKNTKKRPQTYNMYYTYWNVNEPSKKIEAVNPYSLVFKEQYNVNDKYNKKNQWLPFCFKDDPEIFLFVDTEFTGGFL